MDTASDLGAAAVATDGERRMVNGHWKIFHDGYWVKMYEVPADTLAAKKRLIEALTRRLFNHVEYGLNVPGRRLDEARRAFDAETDPAKRRVKGAMLAGALFNRAAEVFTKIVDIQSLGMEIKSNNELMRQCGEYLKEALSLGKMVLHRSGDEGIDELWGEPFKAFAFPIEAFYNSRYIKIAQAMGAVDRIAAMVSATFAPLPMFAGVVTLVPAVADAAKTKCETLQTDPEIFDVWASFVAASDKLCDFAPNLPYEGDPVVTLVAAEGMRLLRSAADLISYITRARVPMPKSTDQLGERLTQFGRRYAAEITVRAERSRTGGVEARH